MIDAFSRLLRAFGDNTGLPGLEPDENGICCIGFDESLLTLHMDRLSGLVRAYCHVGWLPEDHKELLLGKLLRLNDNFSQDFPAYAAVDADDNSVMLMAWRPVTSFTEETFAAFLDNLAAKATEWTELVDSYAARAPEADETDEDMPLLSI